MIPCLISLRPMRREQMQAAARNVIATPASNWESEMVSLTLSKQEIVEATGYTQAPKQLDVLLKAGIPADRRPDGSVRVWRHHILGIAMPTLQQKASRKCPQLASDRKAA